jgi:ribonuclease P protein component
MVTRRGRRVARGPIVVQALLGQPGGPRAGFVVSRKVGNAVTRNRVRRRLREQVRARLDRVPDDGLLLVRAQPSAAEASSAKLGRALDEALRVLVAPP